MAPRSRKLPGEPARRVALGVLIDYERRDAFLNILLSGTLRDSGLERRDRALVTELVQGTVRMMLPIDWALGHFSSRPMDSLEPAVRWSLRMACYQLLYTSVPDYAACDLAAAVVKEKRGRAAAGYVNAVLRAFALGRKNLSFPDPQRDLERYLQLRYSFPAWICRMWLGQLGPERTEALMAALDEQPPLSVRCNLLRADRGSLEERLRREGAEVERSALAPEGLLVRGAGDLSGLEIYARGEISFQDQGSMVVSHLLDPCPGMRVLDMCAAPGGKANHSAELMRNRGEVLALDINGERLELVGRNAMRLGNSIVRVLKADATRAASAVEGGFDRVLVDAPCSGLGTLARKPDARWRRGPEDIESLVMLQDALIRQGASLLRPGGLLVYSTCTISDEENYGVVERFLRERDDYSEMEVPGYARSGSSPAAQLMPDSHGCDGTFAAVLRRRDSRAA